jgi:integrase
MSAALGPRYAVLPYLGAGTGMRQAEMFGLADDDIEFKARRPVIHVRRQVRIVRGTPCFAPFKNRKEHDVPLAASLAPILAGHIQRYPPAPVMPPWKEPDGDPVTFRLIVTRPDGRPWKGPGFESGPLAPCRGQGRHHASACEGGEAQGGARSGHACPAAYRRVRLAERWCRYRGRGRVARGHS